VPQEEILESMLGLGFICSFHGDFRGSGAVSSAWTFCCYALDYLDCGHCGGHLNNIHFSEEKRVAGDFA